MKYFIRRVKQNDPIRKFSLAKSLWRHQRLENILFLHKIYHPKEMLSVLHKRIKFIW